MKIERKTESSIKCKKDIKGERERESKTQNARNRLNNN
jgi:hypothetical protein